MTQALEPKDVMEAPLSTSDVLTVDEAAELLHVNEKTLRTHLRPQGIPHQRVGRGIRFSRAALLDWLSGKRST